MNGTTVEVAELPVFNQETTAASQGYCKGDVYASVPEDELRACDSSFYHLYLSYSNKPPLVS